MSDKGAVVITGASTGIGAACALPFRQILLGEADENRENSLVGMVISHR